MNRQLFRFNRLALPAAILATGISLVAVDSAHAQSTVPLVSFYSPTFSDYFTTSDPAWTCRINNSCTSGWVNPYYDVHAMQGHVYNPELPQPPGTLPLWHWYSGVRVDNFVTTNPLWDPADGTFRSEGGANYEYVRLVGYIEPAGRYPHLNLTTFWNGALGDNATLATAKLVYGGGGSYIPVRVPSGYGRVRIEGSLLPPTYYRLDTCREGYGSYPEPPTWQARGNYIDRWPQPWDFQHNDVIRITAPNDLYRIDHWGTQKPVRGDFGVSGLARVPFPAPGLPRYALLARVTTGRIYVADQGWFESNQWFRALGESSTAEGQCSMYDAYNTVPGELEVGFNDSNLSDNAGWANVTVRQWR
jgi:hypothetical protein